jgi:hypothetical protein
MIFIGQTDRFAWDHLFRSHVQKNLCVILEQHTGFI